MRSSMLFLVGLFALLVSPVKAQQTTVQWGETLEESRKSGVLNFIGQDEDFYYVLKGNLTAWNSSRSIVNYKSPRLQETPNASIVKLDHNMNVVQENVLYLAQADKILTPMAAFLYHGEMYLFSSFRNQKTRLKHVFMQSMDMESLEPRNDLRIVASLPFKNRYLTGQVDFRFSRDSSYMMVFANVQSRKNDPDKFGFHVFNDSMQSIWDRVVVLPSLEKQFIVSDYLVDNDGNTYLVGKRYFGKRKDKIDGRPNYEYVVYSYQGNGEEETEYVLNLPNRFLSELHLEIAPGGDLICAGFYSDIEATSAKGTFFFTVNAETKEIEQESFFEFDMDFLTQSMTPNQKLKTRRKAAKGKDKGLTEYDIRNLIPRGDGGSVLVAEQYYTRTVNTPGGMDGMGSIKVYYHYNNIVVISISPEGEIEWASKIPKRQVSVDDNGIYSSFVTMITAERLHFIYNDHRANLDEGVSSQLKNFKTSDRNGVVVLASVDAKGYVTRSGLFSNKEVNTVCRPKMSSQIASEELFIFGKRGKKTQFGRVLFE